MASQSQKTVTQLLLDWSNGNREALDGLTAMVYDELRRLAGGYLRRERPDHTLQPTALVHEAYLRLIDQNSTQWQSRAHFFGIAARLMRQILVEHARSHNAQKRGGSAVRVTLSDATARIEAQDADVLAVDAALEGLEAVDPQKARIVELRFFTGLTIEETAEALGVSPATVVREWRVGRAWLYREIKSRDA